MANSTGPNVAIDQELWTVVVLQHTFYGVFFWEFFTTLDYEWKVIWGRIPYRWTIWIYSVARVACLMSLILSAIMINATTPYNCQLWIAFELFFFYLALAAASLLIVLRITAIWNRNKVAVSMAIGVWVVNVGFLIQGAAQHRENNSVSVPPLILCALHGSLRNRLTLVSLAATDIVLLLMMLVGLVRLHHGGYATFGMARLLWKQGVIWISLATIVEIPPALSAILDVTARPVIVAYLLSFRSQQFQIPTIITMTIAATRMHRSLVDFATPGMPVTHENFQTSGLKSAKNKQICATPIPLTPMEISVSTVLQQHLALQMSDHGSSTNMDEDVYEGPNGSTLEEDVERGE